MALSSSFLKKPAWIRTKVPSGETWKQVARILEAHRLNTVCDGAQCPNKGECWGAGTAAFMILGDTCTRACRFCAVPTAPRGQAVRPDEGQALALAAQELGLAYLVLTSVDRDDLPDRGAGHFAACVGAVKNAAPHIKVEALIPDYTEAETALALGAAPDVAAHNIETVRSLQKAVRDPRASFDKSLDTLRFAKALGAGATKTSLLLGLGEKPAEVLAAMDEIRAAGVDILVMGQYLRPSVRQIPVAEYIPPEQFERYAQAARERGFSQVASSPLARTSYRAFECWQAQAKDREAVVIEAVGKPPGCKLIRVRAELAGGRISAIQIRGDFFASPEEGFGLVEKALVGAAPHEAGAVFDRFIQSTGVEVFGISGAALEQILGAALQEARDTL
ncbi:MAG: lipoyl synthase [Spirochaetaceae bacterium]|jgi:lipoic acid synthetase|nr:lipoyl synthase [Spirochaetaceae bacterium]